MSEPTRSMSRREFVRGSLLAAGALVLPTGLVSCPPGSRPSRSLKALTAERVAAGATRGLSVFLGGDDYVEAFPNYVAFGLVRDQVGPVGGTDARVWIAPGAGGEGPPAGPFAAPWAAYTHPDAPPPAPQGLNAAELSFERAGIWQMLVEVESEGGAWVGTAAIQVKPEGQTSIRVPGERAIPSPTPTIKNPRGVHPICTRRPPCEFHRITLAKALSLDKPTALIVATPKFCMSRTCGPNLEELILVANDLGDRASFVHVEVYRSDDPQDIQRQVVSPTYRAWGLQSEPWLFCIDRNGLIAKRFEGPVVAPAIRAALKPLVRRGG